MPFFSEGSGDYTISFYLKSTKENQSFSIILSPPGENQQVYPFHQTITADTEWRRYSSTVPLESTVEGFYLAHLISHSGDPAWIDGMQVEKGAELRTLARTAPVEIVAQPHVPNGVSFEDENLVVRITLYGNLGRAALMKATLFDIHGRNFTLSPLNVKGTKPIRRNLVIEPIWESPLGSYRLELQAFDADNKPISRVAEVLLHRVRIPVNSDRFDQDSYFGIHMGRHTATAEKVGLARALGFKWVRDSRNYAWVTGESESGNLEFGDADQVTEIYDKFQMAILGVLGPAPRWATRQPEGFPLDLPLLPENLDAWEAYARNTAARFIDKVHAWEPWPYPHTDHTLSAILVKEISTEPDEGKESLKSENPIVEPLFSLPGDYVAMQRRAYEGARESDESVIIVADLNLNGDRRFADGAIQAGVEEYAGKFSFRDDYSGSYSIERLEQDIEWLKANLPNQSLYWQTTANAHPPQIFNFYRHVPPIFLESGAFDDAASIVHHYLVMIASGVERIFVSGFASDILKDLWRPGPRIFNVDGRLNPNATALSNLIWHIEDKTFSRVYTVGEDFEFFTFEGETGAVGVLISEKGNALQAEELPEGIAVRDLFGNQIDFPGEIGRFPTFLSADNFSASQLNYLFKAVTFEVIP